MPADIHVDIRKDLKVVVDSVFRNVIGFRLQSPRNVTLDFASTSSVVFLLVRALYELPSAL